MIPPAGVLLKELPGFKATGKNQYEARCPAHDDAKASLSISTGTDGRILLKCHAGCSVDAILEKIGLDKKDLFPTNGNKQKSESRLIGTYDYQTADGTLSYQVCRFEPKDFRQRKPDGNGSWIWNIKDLKRLPYNLPDLLSYRIPQTTSSRTLFSLVVECKYR